MKFVNSWVIILFFSVSVSAQHHIPGTGVRGSIELMTGLGNVHHPVTTKSPLAQRYFDQGLALVYAFNHGEAIRSFNRAADLDPSLAMAYWGVALALGPNINAEVDQAAEKAAYDAVQKALALKSDGEERAYITALAKRYSTTPGADLRNLAVAYKQAMADVMKEYPDDLDAATLYAESVMDLTPWKLWTLDGQPASGTEEIVAILEGVLRRDPNHIGANHYYIHVVEASPHPEWALPSADRLAQIVKTAGHLVHMPSHVYMRVGDYAKAATSNRLAAAVDEEFIRRTGIKGIYAAGYYSHNLHFLAIAESMRGRYAQAYAASEQLSRNVTPYLQAIRPLESFLPTSNMVLVRFRKWNTVLAQPRPSEKLILASAIWHWSRAMAFAGLNRIGDADSESSLYMQTIRRLPADSSWGLNSATSICGIATHILAGKLATARHDYSLAVTELREAVRLEDQLAYDEPPAWFIPARESLGGALLLAGNFGEAESVFRADLLRNQRNGRSLFGLAESLRRQGKSRAAEDVKREFEYAWRDADIKLVAGELQ